MCKQMELNCHQRLRGVSFASDAGNVVKSFAGHKNTHPTKLLNATATLMKFKVHTNEFRIIALCTSNKFDWQYNLN